MRPIDKLVRCSALRSRGAAHPARWAPRSAMASAMLCLGAICLPAQALQVLDARDGVAIEAILSIKEPTRIRIDGAPITDVFGNIYASNCGAAAPSVATATAAAAAAGVVSQAPNPAGEIVLECDREKGEIYIRPVGAGLKPVNLFISSSQATYTLVLRKADTPADTIVIRDTSQRTARPMPAVGNAGSTATFGPSANHIRTMKAMLVAMATERVPQDIRVEEVNRPLQLRPDTRFSLVRRFEGRGLIGEQYLLQNTSQTVMLLAEQVFDRPDSQTSGQVVGVAVENHSLLPGETTHVFVIRRGGQ